ncbi:sulfotransferase family protein [Nocardioides silvaticus]|uniref:Sulfotransferase family protein n=1 Tax=Nocardioides silvaticus TaxID=2201891 RepID=A0A316TLL6_9ACTN|nr:sulfotransferase [Nocardioides silvaticus]PWN03094.1 sulfotransferase family protein [Nocardioides silvaticus]
MSEVSTGSTTGGPRQRPDVGSYDDIAAAAVRTTGLTDFGGTAHEEGLRILVDDLASPEAGLTPVGNYFHRSQVKSALVGRLMTEARFAEFPQHAEVPIERPIFVVGLPRTGTTALHRLLCADPAHQGLELWLTEFPQPRPPRDTWESDPIFTAMQSAFQQHHVSNPEFMGIHYMDATSPEECWRLLRQTGKSISYESLANVPRYSAWLAQQDWTDAYDRHRQNLQLVGLHDQDKRWVLKNPSHLVALDSLMKVYPDALIVCTRRDPVTSIASACSLSAEATAEMSTTFVGETIGRTQLDMLQRSWAAFTEARPKYDAAQFVDVDYREFVADPVGTVGGIYSAFDIPWSEEARAEVARIDAESRSGQARPSHRYDLADYGLTEEQVRAAFA